jgi:hypothetical protein
LSQINALLLKANTQILHPLATWSFGNQDLVDRIIKSRYGRSTILQIPAASRPPLIVALILELTESKTNPQEYQRVG